MEYFAGLDVGVNSTAICIIDDCGTVVLEREAGTDPTSIGAVLAPFAPQLRRVGHEAGALSPWLHRGLTSLDLHMVLLETRHAKAALKAQRNKTDQADARGLAQLVRSGWFRDVRVKSDQSYRLRLLLTHRRTLTRKFLDIENAIRHSLKVFGVKLQGSGRGTFDQRARDAVTHDALLAGLVDAMLRARPHCGWNISACTPSSFKSRAMIRSVVASWAFPA
jgi:transposase